MTDLNKTIDRSMQISRGVASTFESRVHDAVQAFTKRVHSAQATFVSPDPSALKPQDFWRDANEYAIDFVQRSILFWDAMRERGNNWIAHEQAGKPPLFAYQYEILADGRAFERPSARISY